MADRGMRAEDIHQGQRLDAVLASAFSDLSRTYLAKLIDEGQVTVDGRRVKASYRIRPGQQINLRVPEAKPPEISPEPIPLDIVYEDQDLLILNKPRGLVVHPAHGNQTGTLVQALLYHCRDLSGIGGVMRPGIVHRIDKDTTGLLAVAKNDKTHLSLSAQLKAHTMRRTYVCLLEGRLKQDGSVDAPIGRDSRDRKRMAVTAQGRSAHTDYRILEVYPRETLAECVLQTGRTHQIRVHMAHIGHPVVGDPVYGFKRQRFQTEGQLLHAFRLTLTHPATEEKMTFEAPIPADFQQILDRLRRENGNTDGVSLA